MSGVSKTKIFFLGIIIFLLPQIARADFLGQRVNFSIDPSFDLTRRSETTATLQKITDQLYFYLDSSWWESLEADKKQEAAASLSGIAQEFEQKIYPILTLNFGAEWKPGIDNDSRITILFHPMFEDAGGYFNTRDEYSRIQVPLSNQREMVYLNTAYISEPGIKSFLAHEFVHLLTFNQKDKIWGISEDVWLNEARAEFAPTLLGYDAPGQSNLMRRIKNFQENPRDSLTEWQGQAADYGVLNLFTQYLVDHYGKEILIDSLKLAKTGISSLNESLKRRGFKEDFSEIFTDWTIAIYLNDCRLGPKYCYLNENLKNFKIAPYLYFLPMVGETTLSIGYLAKDWAGLWQKVVGGNGNLVLEFSGAAGQNFRVPYIIEDLGGNLAIEFLKIDKNQKGKILIPEKKIASLTLIPSLQTKISNFSGAEPAFQFSWIISPQKPEKITEATSSAIKTEPEKQKEPAKKETSQEKPQSGSEKASLPSEESPGFSCQILKKNLYYGLKNNLDVRCLQEFLKAQGQEIYPEGLVTGNFLSRTRAAVIRFQEKYAEEILKPIGLLRGSGFVGFLTRTKINQFLEKILTGRNRWILYLFTPFHLTVFPTLV